MTNKTVVLGSRGSKLALWQTEHVKSLLEAAAPQYSYEIKIIRTKGDKILDVALSKIGDKGLFTKELERELLDGTVDMCVHSMKDMPTQLPDGLAIKGIPTRANVRDALVCSTPGMTIENLPAGARVATGSLRRVAQLRRLRPDIQSCEIRGNVDSRVRRVLDGEFDAGILACAGLQRLGLDSCIASEIPVDVMIPAVAQGAIAVEVRQDDSVTDHLCKLLTDEKTRVSVEAERIVLRELEGGCQVPMGANACVSGTGPETRISIHAFVSTLDGKQFVETFQEAPVELSREAALRAVGHLRQQGADSILEVLR